MMEDAGLIRLGISPDVDTSEAFATQLLAGLSGAVLTGDKVSVEARSGTAFRELLHQRGWVADELWSPLRRDLTDEVEAYNLRIEVVNAETAPARVAVHRAAFPNSTFTVEKWQTMAAASPYRRARCLIGYDDQDAAVAMVTVWSAGPGRPGLLEPLGVHRDHRGHGHGRAISLAAADALRELGSSSATVCTPSSNVGAIAAYASAGFEQLPAVADFRRTTS
jgi:ribosomal protein S18 acetylase RimI-like enzyme